MLKKAYFCLLSCFVLQLKKNRMRNRVTLNIFMFLLFSLVSVTAGAQNPVAIKMEGKVSTQGSPEGCAEQTPGQVTFSNFVGMSNDIWGDPAVDTIYLCGDISTNGDQFDLTISGQDLTGDPDMSTPAGVGYALYTDKPKIAGSDMFMVLQDPHYMSGANFLVATGCDLSGSQTFKNTGSIQGNLAGGDPVCIWFAPITYDKLDPPSPSSCQAVYEGGTCVKVSIDEAFPVVYLNPLEAANIQNHTGTAPNEFGCGGSFIIKGGLPEYNPSTKYTVEITKVSDPSIKAIISTVNITHDHAVSFEVGEGGLYSIHISDGKSCDFQTTVDMPGCTSVGLDFGDTISAQNSVVCIPLTVNDFTDMIGLEFTINWDTSVITFDKLMDLGVLSGGVNANLINSGQLVFSWGNLGGTTLPDGDAIIEICFKLTGPWGSTSPIWIGGNPNGNGIALANKNGEIGLSPSSKKGSVTILNPNAMTIVLDSTAVVCKGDLTGGISATVSGGGGFPVTMDWQEASGAPSGSETLNTDGQTVTVNGLPAGDYLLHFVDNVGAVLDTAITVEDGHELGAGLPQANTLCYGDTMSICPIVSVDGIQIANLTGYSFLWNSGSTAQCKDTIPSGFFAVTVTDPTGCTASSSQTITQKPIIQINPVVTHPSCKGVNNGQIEATPSGGTPTNPGGNYTFNWDNVGTNTNTSSLISGLGAGKHYITVTDDNGCEVSDSFELSYQKVINLAVTGQDIGCFGSDDGKIFGEASHVGGTEALPYTYTWNPTVTVTNKPTVDSIVASSLAPGLYEITVTDGDGCVDSTSVTLSEPDSMNIVLDSLRHESCNAPGMDGFISITASGGAGGYSYDWGGGLTTPTINGLSPANYTVVVTDANGCTKSATYSILPKTPPVITNIARVDVACPGNTDGSLIPTVTNGNGTQLFYSWSNNNVTTANNTNIGVGVYKLNVTDEYGCQATAIDSIVATQGFFIQDTSYIAPTCPGDSDGRIILQMSNPTETYDFAWDYDNTNHTSVLFNIPAGTYNVTITGNTSSCPPINATFTLLDPPSIVTDVTLLQGVSCFDGSALDGSANCTAMYSDGTTGSFNFDWISYSCIGAVSCTATNLGLGDRVVTVSDGVCNVKDTIFIPAPDSVLVTTAITNTSCYGYSDGSIVAIGSGGTGTTYSYGWSPSGQSGPNLTNVPAGNYDLVVTDGVGCSEVFHVVIDEPDSLELLLDLTKTVDVYCAGDSTGQIYVQPVGGNPSTGYTYAWTPNISDSNVASLLSAGTYSVTVSDGKGCTQSLSHVLSENPPISATLNPILEPECYGYQTVISVDTVIGGSGGPYTFSVDYSPPKSISLDFPVFAGDHSIRVFDVYECNTELDVSIAEPDEIFVNLPPSITVELGDSVQLNPVVSSALPIDSFYWTPLTYLMPDSLLYPQVVGLTHDQNYTLVVVDANGCSAEAATTVEVDRNRNVYIPNIFSPNNDGFNDVFFPKTGIGVKQVSFMNIYDRWGEIVYEAKNFLPRDNSSESWNGMYRGKFMNPGVYIYLIEVEFIDGVKLLYRGDITLLR